MRPAPFGLKPRPLRLVQRQRGAVVDRRQPAPERPPWRRANSMLWIAVRKLPT
jgi:hypothetical protein